MSSLDELVIRETETIRIADIGNRQEFLFPERLMLKIDSRLRVSPIDVGGLAYSVRTLRGADGFDVLESSLVQGRREVLRAVLDYVYVSGQRETSIQMFFKNFETVMRWCDSSGHSKVFLSPDHSRIAYIRYTEYLRHSMLVTGEYKPLTCIQRQRALRTLIEIVHPGDSGYVLRGVLPITVIREGRKPPKESDVKLYLHTCISIATQFSSFVIEEKPYPLQVRFSDYNTSIMPYAGSAVTPFTAGRTDNTLSADGSRIATVEEYKVANSWAKPSEAIRAVERAVRFVESANRDSRHDHRMWVASMAMSAYACIFALITGATASEFIQFEYDEAVEVEASLVKKELTAVKFRAAGVTTRYAIGRGHGRALLRGYLQLRKWILEGRQCDYLFFSMRKDGSYIDEYSQLFPNFSTKFFNRIKGTFLPESARNIPPGSVRKFKSLILHELRVSPSLVSDTLNHTERMNTSSYSETSVEKQEDEFSSYWQAVRKAAEVVREQRLAKSVPTVVGHCDDIEQPVRILESVPIEPSCTSQYGCLFCENYLCHADEEDVHKLLSLDYVINAVRDTAQDTSHAERLFRDLSIRIDVIVEAIAARSSESSLLVEKMKRKVNELGVLTPFWEGRLHRYEKLGVIF